MNRPNDWLKSIRNEFGNFLGTDFQVSTHYHDLQNSREIRITTSDGRCYRSAFGYGDKTPAYFSFDAIQTATFNHLHDQIAADALKSISKVTPAMEGKKPVDGILTQ